MNEAALIAAYRGKRVLVTGHTGFKGGWLCLWLKRLGAEVTGVSLPPPPGPSLFASVGLDELVDHRIGNICSPVEYEGVTKGLDVDLVFHLAAQALVRPSYESPAETYLTNVVGTAIVLDGVRRMPSVRGAVVVTSDKCYENKEWAWPYRETDAMGGADPYSSSKGCAELVASAYRRSYFSNPEGCQLATARAGNVFGGGDWAVDRLVPDIVRATLAGRPVSIRNPASVRPWQHVLEPLAGYLLLGAKLMGADAVRYADSWNFGPSPNAFIEVETIARGMIRAWGKGATGIVLSKHPDDPHEAEMLTLDSSKARKQLGWAPRLATDEAVEMTAAWYRAHAAGDANLRLISESQISGYATPGNITPIGQRSKKCA